MLLTGRSGQQALLLNAPSEQPESAPQTTCTGPAAVHVTYNAVAAYDASLMMGMCWCVGAVQVQTCGKQRCRRCRQLQVLRGMKLDGQRSAARQPSRGDMQAEFTVLGLAVSK